MKTSELVDLLAGGIAPVDAHAVPRRFALALVCGVPVAVIVMAGVLGFRADLGEAMQLPMFWVKLGVPVGLALAALVGVTRLGSPGVRLGRVGLALALPLVVLWLLAAVVLVAADAAERPALLMGNTWRVCPFNIAMISLPLFLASFWGMKALAPTRLTLAGACAGLLAGALAAAVYALHCPEMEAPFLAVWYVLGMAIPTLAGALLGPRLLRW